MRTLARWAAVALTVLALAACTAEGEEPSTREREQAAQEQSQKDLTAEVPIPTVDYAPTRRTVAEWIKRWDAPGKVSFVYLMASGTGATLGYYVATGLPVSYCVGLTAPEQIIHQEIPGDGTNRDKVFVVKAPGLDGVYYSGGDCDHYYFFDAGTGAFIEFGGGVSFFAADQPLPIQAEPLGVTTIEDTQQDGFVPVELGEGG